MEEKKQLDYAYQTEDGIRLLCNVFMQFALAVRILNNKQCTIYTLGLSEMRFGCVTCPRHRIHRFWQNGIPKTAFGVECEYIPEYIESEQRLITLIKTDHVHNYYDNTETMHSFPDFAFTL